MIEEPAVAPEPTKAAESARLDKVLAALLLMAVSFRLPGLGWGLPSSDGWDNDGVAPRDFLVGLVESFTPGHYFTYPPLHCLVLGLASAPITLAAVARAGSFEPARIVAEITQVGVMTPVAVVARSVTMLMSLGIIVLSAKTVREFAGRTASLVTAALLVANLSFTYYGQTSNLDVPYLFWGALSLHYGVRAVARNEPKTLRRAFAFAACAVATKDQAYALFALSIPLTLALATRIARSWRTWSAWKEVAIGFVWAAVLLVVIDGIVVNPTGFRARLGFLTGTASQDHAEYSKDAIGGLVLVRDVILHFTYAYPWWVGLPVGLGLGLSLRRTGARVLGSASEGSRLRSLAALMPFFFALSFTLAFNAVARRTEHRFVLPQAIFLAPYAGLAVEAVLERTRRARVIGGALVASFGVALLGPATVVVNLLHDPRYATEAWLAEKTAPGDAIETYGLNVYLPRFPPNRRVVRVGPEPPHRRNPLPGIDEVEDRFERAPLREARYLVVPGAWVGRYTSEPDWLHDVGRIRAPGQRRTSLEEDGSGFFKALFRGHPGFRLVHTASFDGGPFPGLDLHSSLSRPVYVFERVAP